MPEQTIDTSIYRNASPPPANPLDTLGKFVGTMNAVNQNKLFNQTFAARQAIGNAYQQSIDPKTGELDTNKLTSLVAGNPQAAFLTGQVVQEALARKQAKLNIDTSQLNLALNHAKSMTGYFADMVRNPTLSDKDITNAAGEMVSAGLITPQAAAAEFMNIPADPAGRRQWAYSHLLRYMTITGQMEKALPQPQVVNTGGAQQFVDVNPITNPNAAGMSFQNTLTPDAEAAPRQTFVNGQPGTVPTSTVVTPTGMPRANPSGIAPAPTTPSASRSEANTGGDAPAAGVPSSGVPNSPGAPPGFLPSDAPIGRRAAADVMGQQSANQGIDLQRVADAVPARKAILGEMDAALDKFTSGPGANWKLVAKSFVNANNPFGNIFNPNAIASQDVFNKQAMQLAQAQFQALGGTGTDQKLDSTLHTSPNEALSKMGNKEIIALLKGNEDAIAVKNRAWQAWLGSGHGPETYGQFSTKFNRAYDPRVFQFQYLSPTQRKDVMSGMTKNEQNQFRRSFQFAADQGWIPDLRKGQ